MIGIIPSSRATSRFRTTPQAPCRVTFRLARSRHTSNSNSLPEGNGKSVTNPVHVLTRDLSIIAKSSTPSTTSYMCNVNWILFESRRQSGPPPDTTRMSDAAAQKLRTNSQTNNLHKTVLYPNSPSYHY
jgi:hypothetical protein